MSPSAASSSLSFLIFLSFMALLLQLHLTIRFANASLVEETCKAVVAGDPNVNYHFCVKAFKENPTSSKLSDTHGLGELAGLMTIEVISDIKREIDNSTSKTRDTETESCLQVCDKQLSYVMQHTLQAMYNINAREDDSAVDLLIQAVEEINKCGDEFLRAGKPSPLTLGVGNYVGLSTISMVILKMVKQ